MEQFASQNLLRSDGSEVSVREALKDNKILALYFSAHWCPPCRQFTPMLRSAYQGIIHRNHHHSI